MAHEHLLFTRATVFASADRDLTPANCRYNIGLGAWITDEAHPRFMIESEVHRPPGTKKHDLETGEDQKGA